MKQNKEPLLRIAKRDGISRGRAYTIRIISVLLSLVVSGIFIFAAGKTAAKAIDEALSQK